MSAAARLLVGVVLLVCGSAHLTSISRFRAALSAYQLLPSRVAVALAFPIITAELVLAVAYLCGRPAALLGAPGATLFMIFAAAAAASVARGLRHDCGCGPRFLGGQVRKSTVGRALALAALSILATHHTQAYLVDGSGLAMGAAVVCLLASIDIVRALRWVQQPLGESSRQLLPTNDVLGGKGDASRSSTTNAAASHRVTTSDSSRPGR